MKPLLTIVAEIGDNSFNVVDNVGDTFLIETDQMANEFASFWSTRTPSKNWHDVLPERSEPLRSAGTAGRELFASWQGRHDARLRFSLDGRLEADCLPGVGTVGGWWFGDDSTCSTASPRSTSVNDL